MGMDSDRFRAVVELKSFGLALQHFRDEMLEEMTAFRDQLSVRQVQFAIIFDEH